MPKIEHFREWNYCLVLFIERYKFVEETLVEEIIDFGENNVLFLSC